MDRQGKGVTHTPATLGSEGPAGLRERSRQALRPSICRSACWIRAWQGQGRCMSRRLRWAPRHGGRRCEERLPQAALGEGGALRPQGRRETGRGQGAGTSLVPAGLSFPASLSHAVSTLAGQPRGARPASDRGVMGHPQTLLWKGGAGRGPGRSAGWQARPREVTLRLAVWPPLRGRSSQAKGLQPGGPRVQTPRGSRA